MDQPGYDALADLYDRTFPEPYLTPLERHAVAAFADLVHESGIDGVVLDVGCGIGHVTADLHAQGSDVIGIDPSREMLGFARRYHPDLRFVHDDARLAAVDLGGRPVAGILARFSLIHVPPAAIPGVLAGWAERTASGALVAVAGQGTDEVGRVVEFDHRVSRAWRWHPDRMAEVLEAAGFAEVWRTVSRPDDGPHRFPEFHLVARRR